MTGPYLALSASSAFTATGHTSRSARHATKNSDSEDARRRDCVLVGRRDNRVMAVKKREEKGKGKRVKTLRDDVVVVKQDATVL